MDIWCKWGSKGRGGPGRGVRSHTLETEPGEPAVELAGEGGLWTVASVPRTGGWTTAECFTELECNTLFFLFVFWLNRSLPAIYDVPGTVVG